jgi:hypothetical protein
MSLDERAIDRLRAGFAALAEGAVPGADCPAPERIWEAVRAEGDGAERRTLALHAISCPACAEAWRLAREMAEKRVDRGVGTARHAAAPATRRRAAWWAAAGLAASLVVAAGLGLVAWRSAPVAPPAYRAQPGEAVVSLVPQDAVLPRDKCLLRWTGPPGARYDLLVGTADLRTLVRVPNLERGEYLVGADALAGLPAGTPLRWQVEALLPDGTRISSRTFAIVVE